ncbi:unnamed protein product, partial [Discosporangium mesarthrocarpum]
YSTPPKVRISPPADPVGAPAEAVAVLDRRGRLLEVKVTKPGSGY